MLAQRQLVGQERTCTHGTCSAVGGNGQRRMLAKRASEGIQLLFVSVNGRYHREVRRMQALVRSPKPVLLATCSIRTMHAY